MQRLAGVLVEEGVKETDGVAVDVLVAFVELLAALFVGVTLFEGVTDGVGVLLAVAFVELPAALFVGVTDGVGVRDCVGEGEGEVPLASAVVGDPDGVTVAFVELVSFVWRRRW